MLKVWSWRQAIEKAELKPLTKLVLYTLANYMNEHGQGCYPSIPHIAKATCMKERAIYNHINLAEQAGFISRQKRKIAGQEWASNEYVAKYPQGVHVETPLHVETPQGVHVGAVKGCIPVHTNSPVNSPSYVDVVSPAEIYNWLLDLFGGRFVYQPQSINKWLQAGADFELDIKPVASAYLQVRGEPPRSLSWLDDKIANSMEIRKNPLPKGNNYGTQQSTRPNYQQPAKQSISDATREAIAAAHRGEI